MAIHPVLKLLFWGCRVSSASGWWLAGDTVTIILELISGLGVTKRSLEQQNSGFIFIIILCVCMFRSQGGCGQWPFNADSFSQFILCVALENVDWAVFPTQQTHGNIFINDAHFHFRILSPPRSLKTSLIWWNCVFYSFFISSSKLERHRIYSPFFSEHAVVLQNIMFFIFFPNAAYTNARRQMMAPTATFPINSKTKKKKKTTNNDKPNSVKSTSKSIQ